MDQKDVNLISDASYEINVKPKNGLLIFFNSYLEHQFVIDKGIDPFRFIHFNIQVIPNYC